MNSTLYYDEEDYTKDVFVNNFEETESVNSEDWCWSDVDDESTTTHQVAETESPDNFSNFCRTLHILWLPVIFISSNNRHRVWLLYV